MSTRAETAKVALRGGVIGLIACALATTLYWGMTPGWLVPVALPAGVGIAALMAWMLHLARPWVIAVAGLLLSVGGVLATFVVIYSMLDMQSSMQRHPAWPYGVLLIVVAIAYAAAALLAAPLPRPPARHRRTAQSSRD